MQWRYILPRQFEFDGLNGATLYVSSAPGAVILDIQNGKQSAAIHLKPTDFGELAAAVWECSPTGEKNAAQLGIFKGQEQNAPSPTTSSPEAKTNTSQETPVEGTGAGQVSDPRTQGAS